MKTKRTHNRKELAAFRSELRSNLTPAEAFLWTQLKAKKLDDRRFIKQHSIGNFIVDFYCASERLIVEPDGEIHQNPTAEEYDEKRTQFLNSLGYTVLRFENRQVFDHLKSVLMEIKDHFKSDN